MEPLDIMALNEVGDTEDISEAGGLFDMGRVLRRQGVSGLRPASRDRPCRLAVDPIFPIRGLY